MPTTPYGFWPSDWTADMAAAASADYAELRAGHGGVFWVEYRPDEGRCSLWFHRDGQARALTPPNYSVRSRVYEYGGGAFCVTDAGIAFVNEADQQIYLQGLSEGSPTPLTANETRRHGDVLFDPIGNAVLCVEEDHTEKTVQHRLVTIAIPSGERTVIAEGADFYASPALSPDGRRLAWIEWDRPEQPWTSTRLVTSTRSTCGSWTERCRVAGTQGDASLQQPRFDANDRLYCLSDRAGAWQPWCEKAGGWTPVDAERIADHAPAPWQLGGCSYLPLEEGSYLACRLEQGFGVLVACQAGVERRFATPYTRFRSLASDGEQVYVIAAAAHCGSAVLAITWDNGEVRVLAGGHAPLAADELSTAEPFEYPVSGERAHGFFYRPQNAASHAPVGTLPPLVIFLHGGPTSACYPVFDPRIQFWTQRGFAVADLNYRGSSGFGRDYRFRLKGEWGVTDVEDAVAAVDYLAAQGWADGQRAFIRGGSAGGYTALCALAFTDRFRAGASLYGVSDPLALGKATHKFEGDYLDWLIGDPDLDRDRYEARAPLLHAQRITTPVIFFQGGRDAVVVPEQTEHMVEALQRNGIEVEYHLYPDERHGFRQAANLADVLEKELAFYQRCL
ncbi:S9 family peptidase [Pseudomonas matsuisoli]|uniref:Peptidase S9 n=1 Tax=Pseudomonas matsuisoli TaxID=1515666 RepID=A0A917PUQ7_9PSED|nr:S9 family peptidase [Pseudomonas matsuisoli]GGJ92789.1 peptidase S9 [Pseudomonas matsuisoli]